MLLAGMLLAVRIAAVLAGSRSYAAIGEWVIDQPCRAVEDLGVLDGSRPEKSCLRRLFSRVDAEVLDRVLGAWMFTRTAVLDGRRVIAIDDKTVRGARIAGASPPLVAALDHATGTVLGQVAVDLSTGSRRDVQATHPKALPSTRTRCYRRACLRCSRTAVARSSSACARCG